MFKPVQASRVFAAIVASIVFLSPCVAAEYAVPPLAQFNLNRLLGGSPNRAVNDLSRSVQQMVSGVSCEKTMAWLGQLQSDPELRLLAVRQLTLPVGMQPAPQGLRGNPTTVPGYARLLEDERFVPVAGKAYDEFTPQERVKFLHENIQPCLKDARNTAQLTAEQRQANSDFFIQPARTALFVAAVQSFRQAGPKLADWSNELSRLGTEDADIEQYTAIRSESAPWFPFARNQDRQAFETSLTNAYEKSIVPILQQRVSSLLESAREYDGLMAVSSAIEFCRKLKPEKYRNNGDDLLKQLGTKEKELAEQIVSGERAKIAALGKGSVGLENGVAWFKEYRRTLANGRYSSWDYYFLPLQQDFVKQRTEILSQAQDELVKKIKSATTQDEVNKVRARYFPVESDAQTVPGIKLTTAMTEQIDLIEKRAVLGSKADIAKASAPARKSSAGSAASPSASGGSSGSDEPSESEMYDAVNAKLKAFAENQRALAERCQASGSAGMKGDPILGFMCLGSAINGAATKGKNQEASKISHFEKLGCVRARDKPGFNCEYDLGVSGGVAGSMGPTMAAMLSQGRAFARFLKTRDGWEMIRDKKHCSGTAYGGSFSTTVNMECTD